MPSSARYRFRSSDPSGGDVAKSPLLPRILEAMRLFIALNFTKAEREKVYRATRSLREADLPVKWIEPDSYHLTLKFLGNVDQRALAGITAVVDQVAAGTKRFDLVLRGCGAFPTIRKPRVLWVGADPSPALRCLKQDVEWGLANHGFEKETRAFHPHVTVGRATGDEGAGIFRGLDDLAGAIQFTTRIPLKWLDLMRSEATRTGTTYRVVHRGELKRV